MKLFYHHDKRQIVDDEGKEYGPEKAIALYNQGKVENCNCAFLTLRDQGGDFEKVEEYYRGLEQ